MTEAEWLSSTDPQPMLELLGNKVSDRRLRLFAIACCRRIWKLLANERCQRAVEIAERCSEGSLSLTQAYTQGPGLELYFDYDLAKQLAEKTGYSRQACHAAFTAAGLIHGYLNSTQAANVARSVSTAVALQAAPHLADLDYDDLDTFEANALPFRQPESAAQAVILRDIFGNPFRRVTVDPAWLTAKVKTLAHVIYDDRAFERMPELPDALAEAGCTSPDILSHCRGPGPHVRGCWVVDLVLGKG
jgi:hypothetical protein